LCAGDGADWYECAPVLGKRGSRPLRPVDAAPEPGGYAALVTRLPGLALWARVVDWRKSRLAALRNVEVVTGVRLEAEAVREYGAEIVVVATGAHWVADGLNHLTHAPIVGAGRAHVRTP